MRPASCILGLIIFGSSALSAIDFDDLTPITPIQPKVKAAQPAQPKPAEVKTGKENGPSSKQEPIQNIEPIEKKPQSKLDLGTDFDIISEKKEAKPIEPTPPLKPMVKEEPKTTKAPESKINLSPEIPSPIEDEEKKEADANVSKRPPLPSSDDPLNFNDSQEDSNFAASGNESWIALIFMLFVTGLLFLYFWYQKFLRGKMQAHGVDIQVLGQTFLDGQTKIVLLKIGPKVIVMAKSPQFCTTLDVITDPEEINLLTLGSSAAASGEDFSSMLNDMQSTVGSNTKRIPNEKEMRSELDQLKKQLGQYQKDVR